MENWKFELFFLILPKSLPPASDYQLKLLSSQRAKAAASGSKKRIFITPNYQDDELDVEKPKKPKIQPSKQRSSLLSKLPRASGSGAWCLTLNFWDLV